MTRLLWLPDRLRLWDLPVVEVEGWQDRGRDFAATPRVAVGHHTATPASAAGDLPTLRILVEGRSDLRGPLCQVALSRSGVAHVVAAGKANHGGVGEWNGINQSSLTVGCEVEHPGKGAWDPKLLQAFDRVMAALLDGLDQPASMYCGHREWAKPDGRKVDPGGVDLTLQRQRIAALLHRGPIVPPPAPPAEPLEDDVARLIKTAAKGAVYGTDGTQRWHVPNPVVLRDLVAAGVYGDGKVTVVTQETIDALPLKETTL